MELVCANEILGMKSHVKEEQFGRKGFLHMGILTKGTDIIVVLQALSLV